uniref:Uncharacterized protein n=1 Tax=Glossina palpalis gambiensis TaxID=67801 RepID=A0A1B0C498_9MUSC
MQTTPINRTGSVPANVEEQAKKLVGHVSMAYDETIARSIDCPKWKPVRWSNADIAAKKKKCLGARRKLQWNCTKPKYDMKRSTKYGGVAYTCQASKQVDKLMRTAALRVRFLTLSLEAACVISGMLPPDILANQLTKVNDFEESICVIVMVRHKLNIVRIGTNVNNADK